MNLIILGILTILCAVIAALLGTMMIKQGISDLDRLPPWTIVENGKGEYSFIDRRGKVANGTFSSKEEAARVALEVRAMISLLESEHIEIPNAEAIRSQRTKDFRPVTTPNRSP